MAVRIETHFHRILQCSLQQAPEQMLDEYLRICMELSGASGGSILAEEGSHLKFLFSDLKKLIGMVVPWKSIAGETARRSVVIYTYAPSDKRHFSGVDTQTELQTQYLLSIPIVSIHSTRESAGAVKSAGVLQLLFGENILPGSDVQTKASEFSLETIREQDCYEGTLQDVFWVLPNIAFGMEVMRLRQTSYQVIHELKNKFIATESWLNCLREDIEDTQPVVFEDETVQEDFELAVNAAHEGASLSKGYLQFTKLYTPEFVQADVNTVLKETAANIRVFAAENGAASFAVETDFDTMLPPRKLDPAQLKMALYNLGKNAAEALIEHQVHGPKVTLKSEAIDGTRVRLTVADNGPGMPEEIAANLFVAFATKKEGGTGLGLTITKKIIDIHGGTIRCETGQEGTRFLIEL